MIWEVTNSRAFEKAVKLSFKKVDKDRTGTLSRDELTLAMCYFVFNLSKKVPGIAQPPTTTDVETFMQAYDGDGSGDLNLEEYEALVKAWVQENGKNFMWILAGGLVLNFAVIPLVATEIHQQTRLTRKIPVSVIAGGLALIVKRAATALQRP